MSCLPPLRVKGQAASKHKSVKHKSVKQFKCANLLHLPLQKLAVQPALLCGYQYHNWGSFPRRHTVSIDTRKYFGAVLKSVAC